MRIVYLLESAGLWGGVKAILEAANRLTERGHIVTVVSRGPEPVWMDLACRFVTVPSFETAHVPSADIVVGTYWTTVPAAVACRRGIPVHYCQGYEGDNPENTALRDRIERVYRLPEPRRITISPHLATSLQRRFGWQPRLVRYAVDHDVMFPADPRPPARVTRVGLVGPYEIAWKDLATGLAACNLAKQAGLNLQIVRITNTAPHPDELKLDVGIEWHVQVEPKQMGALYRSMDVFLGSSWGEEEGFFLPAVEAMACGVPCVLTDIPCHRDYGDAQYALFVAPRNPHSMAEALVMASGHPAARAALREHGLRTARAFNYEDHVNDLERAFTEIMDAERTGITKPARADLECKITPQLDEGELAGMTRAAAEALRCLADAYSASQRYGEAANHLEAAAKLCPDDTELWQTSVRARERARAGPC